MRYSILATALLTTCVCSSAAAQQAEPFRADRIVTVMTRNVYHGVLQLVGATHLS